MIYDKHANLKYKYGNRHFWAEGYYVSTVGLNEATIKFQIGKICCHHCIIRHFQFRKCLPVNSNSFISISRRSLKRQIRFGTAIRKLNKSEMPHTTSRVITAPK